MCSELLADVNLLMSTCRCVGSKLPAALDYQLTIAINASHQNSRSLPSVER